MEGTVVPSNTGAITGRNLLTTPVRRRVRRVGVGSSFKIGMVLSALIFAVIGLFAVLLPGLLGASMFAAFGGQDAPGAGGGTLVVSVIVYIVGIIGYAVFGGLFGALYAWLYNVVAGWVGGIEIELSGE